MGSSGSGRISDYPGTSTDRGNEGRSDGGGAGQPPGDRCGRAFSTPMEDIEHSEYYAAHNAPPAIGVPLRIRLRKRLVAETSDGQSVGNIPTSHNFLAACLKGGWNYTGRVTSSNGGPPLASLRADFAAIAPE